ncbi:MAG TPA: A24 family peptidase [Patescibacteria group bacterium]|nr:A24 family peptidase [Patescibacteria group bacterium]
MIIETWYWLLVLTVAGLLAGSFAGAQVWRLRWAQLQDEKKNDESYDRKEYKKLKVLKTKAHQHDRSKCLHCGRQLAWYDLLPVLSWTSTLGRCRYCKQSIGWFEPLMELGMVAAFVLSYLTWPFALQGPVDATMFVTWLLALVVGGILFAYDLKWSWLPNTMLYALLVLAGLLATLALWQGDTSWQSLLGGVVLFGGVYGGLYGFSRWRYGEEGTWVGLGDVYLSVALGLFLMSWQLSFLAIFLANLLGTLIVLPWLLRGKLSRKAHIPFGPLLLVATFIGVMYGQVLIRWYFDLFSL